MSLPPHFVDEKKKEVVFHLKGTFQFKWQFLLGCNLFQKVLTGLLVDVKKPSTS